MVFIPDFLRFPGILFSFREWEFLPSILSVIIFDSMVNTIWN